MLWPSVEDLRDASWKDELAWDEGPPLSDVVVALIPALRVLFLQGWRTVSINFAEGMSTGQSTEWRSLDVATLELTTEMLAFDREWSGLNVAFDVVPMNDTHGPTENGYSMWVEVLSLGIDEPMATNGKIPNDLEVSIDDFVETGVERLAELIPDPDADPPRADNQGLVWIFDSQHWFGLGYYGTVVADYALRLLREGPADFIRGQVYDDSRKHDKRLFKRRQHPNLDWLFERPAYPPFAGQFWNQVGLALQGRGEAHRLTMADRRRLRALAWLDAIVELMSLGAIDMAGLIAPADPVEPLVARPIHDETGAIDDETAELIVWGEERVTLVRVTPLLGKRTLEGSVAWDYAPGDTDNKPRVLLVVSRGIAIGDDWNPDFPWVLDIIRVQDDALVPSEGEAIDPTLILTPALLEPQPGERLELFGDLVPVWSGMFPRVAASPKRDGLFLQFPIWGNAVEQVDEEGLSEQAASLGTVIPFGVELTLDPRSGSDGFIVDVHFYTYPWMAYHEGGVHISVWATAGVTIHSNGDPIDGDSAATSQAVGDNDHAGLWTASAEFWEVDSITDVKRPWEADLQITPRLAYQDECIRESVPRFPDTGNTMHVTVGSNDVYLSKKTYTHKSFLYEESFWFDFIDVMLGFIPFIGDAADLAEVAYVWNTGYDKWGRPVSDFQLALMTIGAGVPLLSSSFVGKAAKLVEGNPLAAVRGEELAFLFTRSAANLGADPHDVEAALSVSAAWKTDGRLRDTASKQEMVGELIDFIGKNTKKVEDYAEKLVAGSVDEWLGLPDILDDAATGFRINSVQTGYLNWCKTHPGTTPAQYIETGISGRAKVMAEALLGNEAVGGALRQAHRAAKNTGYPSALGRRALGGVTKKLAQITADQVATQLVSYVTRALAATSRNTVMSTQAMRPLTAVVAHPLSFFEDGARALLTRLAPTTPLGQMTGNVLESLLGKDNLNGALVSLEERSARFADALFTVYAELKDKGIAVTVMFQTEMLPVTATFVRSFIARVGRENGSRFEFRMAAFIQTELASATVVVRHQLKLPTLLKKLLLSGPDSVLYMRGQAFLMQLKSYQRLEDLIDGPVEIVKDSAGNIVSVTGPSLIQQVIKDAARLKHWNYKVPPPGVEWNAIDPPLDQSDWIDIADVHALVVDDIYLRDKAFSLLSEASKRTKKRKINIMEDIDAPEHVRESLRQYLGDEVYPENLVLMEDLLETWVTAQIGEMQNTINALMVSDDMVATLGKKLQFRIFVGGQPVSGMYEELIDAADDIAAGIDEYVGAQ